METGRARSALWSALFFAFILIILLINIKSPYNFYDEGFAVFGAERVLRGDAPYRDFWAIYPPGQFYLLAGLFKLFGTNLIHARVLDTLIRLGLVASIYGLTTHLTSRRMALLVSFTAAVMLGAAAFYSYAVFPALALNLTAMLCFAIYTQHCQRRWLFLSGLLVGAASLIRWDLGLYGGLSIFSAAFLFALISPRPIPTASEPQPLSAPKVTIRSLTTAFKDSLIMPGGMLIVSLLGYGLFIARSGWADLFEQVFVFPVTVLHDVRWLPYPPLNPFNASALMPWMQFYLPLLVFATAILYYAVHLIGRRAVFTRQHVIAVGLVIFGLCLFLQALSRYDYIHVLPSTLIALIVAFSLVSRLRGGRETAFTGEVLPILLVLLISFYLIPAATGLLSAYRSFSPFGCYSTIEKAGCVALAADQEQAALYLQSQTSPQDEIFVGNRQHDSIFVNDIGFYFLADRPAGSRYHELYPGVATTLPVQEAIAAEIETRNLQWAVLVNIWLSNEPNASRLSSGVDHLDRLFQEKFEPVNQYGIYQIWRRTSD